MGDENLKERIRRARGKFAAMAGTYALGVFNDQFYKQAAMLLAVALGMEHVQGHVLFVFTLPYIVFAAYAGWMADRFAKRHIVIGAKFMELAAMICGGLGIACQSWPLVLVMAGIMAWQSCIFSPALNGSIPELYPASYVMRANGILKMFVTASILLGVAAAGPVLDIGGGQAAALTDTASQAVPGPDSAPAPAENPTGRWAVAVTVVSISLLGVAVSLFVPRRAPADPTARFPWSGPLETVRRLWRTRKDSLLWTIIWADVFIWFLGSVQIMLINVLGVRQFHFSKTLTSLLLAAEVSGIAVGGLLIGWLARGQRWHRVLVPSALVMAAAMALIAGVPWLAGPVQPAALLALLGAAGIAGGTFMIPCEAFIQVRPAPEKRGTVIASANFAIFAGIALSSWVGNRLNEWLQPTVSFALLAGLSVLTAGVLAAVLPRKGRTA